MSSSNLIRWSGLAALIGGLLFVVADVLETILFGNLSSAQAAATGAWIFVQGFYLLAVALISLGLIGLYARQVEQAGTLGVVAFVVAFIGEMLSAGSAWSEAVFGSWLAKAAPQLLEGDPAAIVIFAVIISYLLFGLGWFLLGLASLRAGLFLVLGILMIPFAGVVYGVAVAWMGYALWSGASQPALSAEAAT
jgi:uncharacterized membrane protein YedE/YeeE